MHKQEQLVLFVFFLHLETPLLISYTLNSGQKNLVCDIFRKILPISNYTMMPFVQNRNQCVEIP